MQRIKMISIEYWKVGLLLDCKLVFKLSTQLKVGLELFLPPINFERYRWKVFTHRTVSFYLIDSRFIALNLRYRKLL